MLVRRSTFGTPFGLEFVVDVFKKGIFVFGFNRISLPYLLLEEFNDFAVIASSTVTSNTKPDVEPNEALIRLGHVLLTLLETDPALGGLGD